MLPLYKRCTASEAVAAFGDPAKATFYCGRQFAVFPRFTLCFATMGDPETGTRMVSPSEVSWKPARLDYHPGSREPRLPGRLTRCVERDGKWLPLHHMFLRAAGDRRFVYAGVAELPMFGEISEGGRIRHSARFHLDAKLPRDLWVRLGGYPGRLVSVNGGERRFADDDAAGFERLLADLPITPGYLMVTLTGYEEWSLALRFNATRAKLWYRPLYWPYRQADEPGFESRDPDCAHPRRHERFGNDGHGDVTYPAGQTVPRELAVRAAVEHFRTGRLPECVRWRKLETPAWVRRRD